MKKFKIVLLGTIMLGVSGIIVTNKFQSKENNKEPIFIIEMAQEDLNNVPEDINLIDESLKENEDSQEETNIKEAQEVLRAEEDKEQMEEKTLKSQISNSSEKKSNSSLNKKSSVENKNDILKDKSSIETKSDHFFSEGKEENNTDVESKNYTVINPNAEEEKSKEEIVPFYASITHGKKEFSSENNALKVGEIIANLELKSVMDYNEQHPDAQIQPDINYFRVYPSVKDTNGKYWYYLHFFCQSGENKDDSLKKTYEKYIKEKYPNLT